MEDVGIFYVHYFLGILRLFGMFCGQLVYFMVYFSRFGTKKYMASLT
jgi:hypothetical protein